MRVIHGERRFDAAGYVGSRPTFGEGPPVLEAYLLDFAGDLYGEEVEIEFIAKLRGDMTFADPEALSAQMGKDCADARSLLARIGAQDPMHEFPIGRALAAATMATATGM